MNLWLRPARLAVYALVLWSGAARGDELFEREVKPILDARCVACHSCFDAPCQLNLQSLDGALRGAHPRRVYDGTRLEPVELTRMFEDASGLDAWRKRGFYDVLGRPDSSLLLRLLALADKRTERPDIGARQNEVCVATEAEMQALEKDHADFAMPYGLPALSPAERQKLAAWVARPRGEPARLGVEKLPPPARALVAAWEAFLNGREPRQRLVARYLYEHLFLAGFEAAEAPGAVLKLVRSHTPCGAGVVPISSRWPNEDPGTASWQYCFYQDPATPVYKKHIPYELSERKLRRLGELFASEPWSVGELPTYDREVAANPFKTYRAIPVTIRYRFLLEDARYHVMTFIKGPVCDGNVAVNSIRDQFYIFFMDPRADTMARDGVAAGELEDLLILPGSLDAANDLVKIGADYGRLVALRTRYREVHNAQVKRFFPQGVPLEAIWDGDGTNPNAVLTVFRHLDNAAVEQGALGDLPRTVFVLDYSIFERLTYNLVVNFDVFGSVKHQALTRLYMDLLRMEAEDNYLELLPKDERLPLKKSWYRGLPTALQLHLLKETELADVPSALVFPAGRDRHREAVRQLLFTRLRGAARGPEDAINWKVLHEPSPVADPLAAALRKVASVRSSSAQPFARFFPPFSLLLVPQGEGRAPRVFSLIHNRELENVAWMFLEDLRIDEGGSSLTVLEGVLGGYVNELFVVKEADVPAFVDQIGGVDSAKAYQRLRERFALDRMDPSFWSHYDALHRRAGVAAGATRGVLDLSRYEL